MIAIAFVPPQIAEACIRLWFRKSDLKARQIEFAAAFSREWADARQDDTMLALAERCGVPTVQAAEKAVVEARVELEKMIMLYGDEMFDMKQPS